MSNLSGHMLYSGRLLIFCTMTCLMYLTSATLLLSCTDATGTNDSTAAHSFQALLTELDSKCEDMVKKTEACVGHGRNKKLPPTEACRCVLAVDSSCLCSVVDRSTLLPELYQFLVTNTRCCVMSTALPSDTYEASVNMMLMLVFMTCSTALDLCCISSLLSLSMTCY